MDIAILLGLVIGVTVVTLAFMTGSELSIFLNLPGFLIVCGGTFAATLIKFPISGVFVAFFVDIRAAFVRESPPRGLPTAARWSKTTHRKTSPGTGASKSQSRLRLSKADRGF